MIIFTSTQVKHIYSLLTMRRTSMENSKTGNYMSGGGIPGYLIYQIQNACTRWTQ